MEFQKFWKEKDRMCDSFPRCNLCQIYKESEKIEKIISTTTCDLFIANNPKTAEKIVEKWAAENPVMTNGQKFCEVFGIDLIVIPVYSKNDPRIHIKGMPFEEWLQAEYKPPQEVKR